jgi:uncharacterized SAM-binding protein YcdF (DUF218 family)
LVNELTKINRSHIIIVRVILIATCAFLISSSFALWLATEGSSEFRANLRDRIRKELIREDLKRFTNVVDAIYLLGGSQNSLEFKFKKAADLYHDGICKRILILHRPGKTEYSGLLRRNLANDEWAILKLEEFGIPKKIVEVIRIKEEFFGTLTEAKGISSLIKKRRYKSVILISSASHTHRVKISFENFLQHDSIKVYVQSSDEKGSLGQLLIELIKLKIYEYFLV